MGRLKLSPQQRVALETLTRILPPSSYLAGGLAVAAHLGHRSSRDFDVFAPSVDTVQLVASMRAFPEVRVIDVAEGTLHLMVNGVPVSVLEYRYPLLEAPTLGEDGVPIAALEDLACMKLSAIAGRGAARDFWDLQEILNAKSWTLDHALDLFGRKYARVDTGHVLRSLVYFAEAETEPRPEGLGDALWEAIKTEFRTRVKALA